MNQGAGDFTRLVLEQIAQAVATGLESALGQGIDIGVHSRFDDDVVTSRLLPLRAALVNFEGQLSDCIIGVSTMREDVLTPAMAAAGLAIANELGVQAQVSAPQVHVYEEKEDALEQLEALWEESTVHFHTPKGDLLLVIGRGLVHSIERLSGHHQHEDVPGIVSGLEHAPAVREPISDELAAAAATVLAGPQMLEGSTNVPNAGRAGEFVGAAHSSGAATGGDLSGSDIDAMLATAADMGAVPQSVAHPHMQQFSNPSAFDDTAAANYASASDQWAQLLSGVEVDITAELGRTSMRLGDVASLVDESVLTLDQLVDEPVTVYVNGSLYATARLVVVDNEYGIEIVDVVGQEAVESELAGAPDAAAAAA